MIFNLTRYITVPMVLMELELGMATPMPIRGGVDIARQLCLVKGFTKGPTFKLLITRVLKVALQVVRLLLISFTLAYLT